MYYALLSTVAHIALAPLIVGRALWRCMSWKALKCRWFVASDASHCDVLFHAVSVGEVVAVSPLIERLHSKLPAVRLMITTGTETGVLEARRRLPNIPAAILPLDTPWGAAKLMRRLRPRIVFLSEGDLWPGMLYTLYRQRIPVVIVNAKCSDRSWHVWQRLKRVAWWLYRPIMHCCCQDALAAARLKQLCRSAKSIIVTGNLKQDVTEPAISAADATYWKLRLDITEADRVVLLASTHPGEERLLLTALKPIIDAGWKVVVVPRHVHRVNEVMAAVNSVVGEGPQRKNIKCVFEMGVLTKLMQLSSVVVVAGSFIPGVGGHNLLEPGRFGKPVLFGPEHQKQLALAHRVLQHELGACVQLEELCEAVLHWEQRHVHVLQEEHSPLEVTWRHLMPILREANIAQ